MAKTARETTRVGKLLAIDPWLIPHKTDIALRIGNYFKARDRICGEGTLADFASAYKYYGIHNQEGMWVCREWIPDARAVSLIGEFNGWDKHANPLSASSNGDWELILDGDALQNGQQVKLHVEFQDGRWRDLLPAYINRVVQNKDNSFCGVVWDSQFKWKSRYTPAHCDPLLIYEAHIGMAQEKGGMGTYREFEANVLPRIKADGYTAIQLMAIMEHPYYASFGYQVGSLFAPANWFGSPDDLKSLIDAAHKLDIAVLLDIVHSHAAPNINEGIAGWDEHGGRYFMQGERGMHSAWGTRLYDYSRDETLRLLLSNLNYWMDEFRVDGFRFDGVTSMLYWDHGLGSAFDNYNKYFSLNSNVDAEIYLMLANELIHHNRRANISIAEDMSGMPGLCMPLTSGGFGFDYRLAMGVPDMWIKLTKDTPDESWDMNHIYYELTQHRWQEKRVAYCESHDQALVGDKTLIFRMADSHMYTDMASYMHNPDIDRAVSLHKMIRLITLTLGGDAYLNFMGNEFGHPEWIDFPREGNGWSFHYARRQWSLCDNGLLKYHALNLFDNDMLKLVKESDQMGVEPENLWVDEQRKLLAYKKGELIYLFNFHPTNSYPDFFLPTHVEASFKVIFSTDRGQYDGQNRIDENYVYKARPAFGQGVGMEIYIPSRTAAVLKQVQQK